MDPILFQVKSAIDSATRPMESLQQKRNPSETKVTKKCIVSPEIEVTILHNANLDLEILLKQKKEEVKRLEARVEEMKASIQGLQEEKMQMLKKHEEDIQSVVISIPKEKKEEEDVVGDGKIEKELVICKEENSRLREEVKRMNEKNETMQSSTQTEIQSLSQKNKQYEKELELATSNKAELVTQLENSRKEIEELKQQLEQVKATPEETTEAQSEVDVLKKQLSEQTEKAIKNQSEIDELKSELSKAQAFQQQATEQVTELQTKLEVSEKELGTARLNSTHFLEDIQSVKQQSSSLKQQLQESEEMNKDLKEQLQKMSESLQVAESERKKWELLEKNMREQLKVMEEQAQLKEEKKKNQEKDDKDDERKEEEEEERKKEREHYQLLIQKLEKELVEKEKEINEMKVNVTQLKEKELNCTRYETQSTRLTEEISNLHNQIQKQTSQWNEKENTMENRIQFAEQSLEVYKKEMEDTIKEKTQAESSLQEVKTNMDVLQKAYDNNLLDLNNTREVIRTYEQTITNLQQMISQKDELIINQKQKIAELEVLNTKEISEKNSVIQTFSEESVRLQAQYELLSEENTRLRQALEKNRVEDETTLSLLHDSEAKIDHWRVGLENSYQQKRVLKEAMRQVLETNSQLNEKIQREHSARRALERTLMTREDYESGKKQKQQDEGFDEEFYSLDWGRKLSRFIARNATQWNEYTENAPALPEEAAIPVIQNTIDTLEWTEMEKNYLCNWVDFFAHGGMIENGNRFSRSLQIQGITFDILDGFLTLIIPFLKSGIRSDYSVSTFIKQKPSVICDLEIAITPVHQKVTGDVVDSDPSKVIIHKY